MDFKGRRKNGWQNFVFTKLNFFREINGQLFLGILGVNFDSKKLSQIEPSQFFKHMALNPVPCPFYKNQICPKLGELIFPHVRYFSGHIFDFRAFPREIPL